MTPRNRIGKLLQQYSLLSNPLSVSPTAHQDRKSSYPIPSLEVINQMIAVIEEGGCVGASVPRVSIFAEKNKIDFFCQSRI